MAHWKLSIQASIQASIHRQAINPVNHHNLERIDALLRQARVVCAGRVAWFEEIDSTNSWLMKQHQIDDENQSDTHGDIHRDIHGRVCLAELQTAGRGRRGRVWRASRSSSVLLSLGWHLGAVASAGLSLVSGLAIIDGLRRTGIDGVGLKWPNDVMSGGKKLGGVLTELSGEHCVVGMGINVAMPSDNDADNNAPDAPDAVDETADENAPRTDLKSLGHDIDRDALAANLIIAHCHYLQHFCRGGFAQFVTEWNELNVHQGRAVSVRSSRASGSASSRSCDGIVRGVDRDGALLIDHNGTRRRLISAQVRIRPLDERMRESCANES